MGNATVLAVSASSLDDLITIIINALTLSCDVQFFISDALYNRLLMENEAKTIWKEDVVDSLHYFVNVEKAIIFSLTNRTVQINFARNCQDFMQITFFASKGTLYRHYLSGLDVIMIIDSD